MDKELENKISDILSSPDELKKIMNIVGGLGLNKSDDIETEVIEKPSANQSESSDTGDGQTSEKNETLSELEKLFSHGKKERLGLLSALKPYLKEGKREKIDTLIRLLNAAEILLSAKNFL